MRWRGEAEQGCGAGRGVNDDVWLTPVVRVADPRDPCG